ncbi:MAG TPA: TraR/DksA family transcriptional regulator [Candidatus Acidoferrum sp.]|nr:TraR/DksA family transcriptional regulator [Candidatus Acidoferrum sp.]
MPTATKSHNKRYAGLEKLLQAKRDELLSRRNSRLGEVTIDLEPDDEGAVASSSFATDLALVTLERENQELSEIDAALGRIKSGEYGLCEVCENPIPEARLQALPWARLCIRCAGRASHVAVAQD